MSWKTSLSVPDRLKPHKLSWKLTCIYAVLFSAVLIALNAGTLFGVRYFMVEEAKSQVRSSTAHTLSLIVSSTGQADLLDPRELSESGTAPEIGVRITDAAGKTVGTSGEAVSGLPAPSSNIGVPTKTELNDRHLIVENERITKNGRLLGYLQVSYDMHADYHFIKLLFVFMAFADLLGVALSVFAGTLLSRRALRPIDRLTAAAKRISASDLDQRVEVGTADDELSRLAATFNEMIERLQQSFQKQNRFVSDASHELRTPIAVIKGYADLIDQWAKDDPKVLEESVAAIRKEAKSMTGLTEKLLFLARGDSGALTLHKEDFPVSALFEELAEESRLIAPNHHFASSAPGGLLLHADRRLLKQALRALTDNAVKYTPEGGDIRLEAQESERQVILRVRDNGIGIPESERTKLFDRFYRVDRDRSREKGGSGLGLSIVKWIVEAHGGTVRIEGNPDGGTCIVIQLPANR